jgi:hypothetical protein
MYSGLHYELITTHGGEKIWGDGVRKCVCKQEPSLIGCWEFGNIEVVSLE